MRQNSALIAGLAALAVCGCTREAGAPTPSPSPTSASHPLKDHPVRLEDDHLVAMDKAMQPLIKQARAELPVVQERFSRGLPSGNVLYVTIRLPIPDGLWEQAFVAVRTWESGRIQGNLASELRHLEQPRLGDRLTFADEQVVDWTIIGRDGREEGNRLGHFLEGN